MTGKIAPEEFSRGAELAVQWTREVITPENLAFLEDLNPVANEGPIGLYHASPRDPVWEYVLSALLAQLCMDIQRHRVCLIGHSHVALSFARQESEVASGEPRREGTELNIAAGEWLLNPGSVGQPRDGDPRAAWLELDTDEGTARYHRVAYDVVAAGAAILEAGLPTALAERLQIGRLRHAHKAPENPRQMPPKEPISPETRGQLQGKYRLRSVL